jgi:ribosomal protein L7/L12
MTLTSGDRDGCRGKVMAEIIETIADLKRDLERIERKLDYLFRKMEIEYVESDLPSFMLEATQLIRHGRRDEAMRLIREYTAVGLYEAKEQVEQIERNIGLAPR